MEFFNCLVKLKIEKTFKATDAEFEKLLDAAIKAKPCLLAFDLDFDYEGIVGASGMQVNVDSTKEGQYSINKQADGQYCVNANGTWSGRLMFFNESGFNAFKSALSKNNIKTTIASIANNGDNKKTYWSLECSPAIALDATEVSIAES